MSDDYKIVVAQGGFDPIHRGQIEYLKEARKLGDRLVVALASDNALIQKKKHYLLGWEDRHSVISNLSAVNEVIYIDDYYNSQQIVLDQLRKRYPNSTIVFAFGGAQTESNTLQIKDHDVVAEYNVGGNERQNNSSNILRAFAEYVRSVSNYEAGPNGRYT